jgi:hypothetical protein
MSGFADDLTRFTARLERMTNALLPNVASAAQTSIVDGPPVTGAPGQPVGQYGPGYHPGEVGGTLRASWILEFPSATTAQIATHLAYAPANEHGIRADGGPYRQRSTVGGRHSVALTVGGFQRLVDAEVLALQEAADAG